MIITNLEGEGLSDAREFFRKKLVEMGVIDPTEEDMKRMQEAAANAQPDPNAVFVQAAAEKAMADAEKARADAVLTMAKTEETQAKTIKTLEEVGEPAGATGGSAPSAPAATAMDEYEAVKREFEIEKMRIEMAEKLMKLRQMEQDSFKTDAETQNEVETQNVLIETRESVKEAVDGMKESITGFQKAIEAMVDVTRQNAENAARVSEQAVAAINKPKRVVRENGKIVGIQ
jgi:hypothetical protein